MQLKRKILGTIPFDNETITATDPCYDKDVWCRLDNIKIKPGTWETSIYTDPEKNIVRILQIRRKHSAKTPSDNAEWVHVGTIGVDAGLAGFFYEKPNYNDTDWSNFCDDFYRPHGTKPQFAHITTPNNFGKCNGVVACSGWGDGDYDIVGIKNKKDEFISLELRF